MGQAPLKTVNQHGRCGHSEAGWAKDTMKQTSWMMALFFSSSSDSSLCVGDTVGYSCQLAPQGP